MSKYNGKCIFVVARQGGTTCFACVIFLGFLVCMVLLDLGESESGESHETSSNGSQTSHRVCKKYYTLLNLIQKKKDYVSVDRCSGRWVK